jgi:hypothetical protein
MSSLLPVLLIVIYMRGMFADCTRVSRAKDQVYLGHELGWLPVISNQDAD